MKEIILQKSNFRCRENISICRPLMLSAHGPIFCRKQLREKIGPIFSRTKSQRTRTDFLSELLCVTIIGEVLLLDDVTPIFSRTEVNAHGPIFCRKQLREKIGAILYRSKSQRTRTDFRSDFLSTTKNRSVCAGHKAPAAPSGRICEKNTFIHAYTIRIGIIKHSCVKCLSISYLS